MPEASKPTLLVTGAGGHLGRQVVELLLQSGAGRVIAATRSPEKLKDLAEKGAELRKADFDDSASLAAAFAGADRLLLISTDALGVPGKRLTQHLAAVVAAEQAGVKHVVYTSMPKPEPGSPIPFAPDHLGTERALAESGLTWTVLRNSWYMENLFMTLPSVLSSGRWYTSAGEGRVAYVAREDCARAAAAALFSSSTANVIYDITGPEAPTTAEIAALVSEATGGSIELVQVSDEQLGEGMAAAGVPDFLIPVLVGFDANTLQGNMESVSDVVERLTGSAPQTLARFLAQNRQALPAAA
jgi:NAD(P)H dehydrogenase (quinone)